MYAIAFDLVVVELKANYGESYNSACCEIKTLLKEFGFQWARSGAYLWADNYLTKVYLAINELSSIEWFKNLLRDIRVFRSEDLSNFAQVVDC